MKMIYLFMGVSGVGKTFFGRQFAKKIGAEFLDADDFHSQSNKTKMKIGIALKDHDRKLWLKQIRKKIIDYKTLDKSVVIACSALKEAYRNQLLCNLENCLIIFLKGDRKIIRKRLLLRKNHFFNINLLDSQYDILEIPLTNVLNIDIDKINNIDMLQKEINDALKST